MCRRLGWLLCVALSLLSFAAMAAPQAVLSADQAFRVAAQRGRDDQIILRWTIAPGHYLYRDAIAVTTSSGAVPISTPAGVTKEDPTFGTGEVYLSHAEASFAPPSARSVSVAYRGCQENGICYPIAYKTLDVQTLQIRASGTRFAPANPSGWQTSDSSPQASPGAVDDAAADPTGADASLFAGLASRGGLALVVLSFAGFGLLLAFTPCVLPMYPILGGMLARQGEALTAGRGFVASSAYVLAMAVAFGFLGMAAAWSGQNLQVVLQSPVSVGVMATVFVVLALSSFGVFDLALPAAITDRVVQSGSGRRGSLTAAALLGFTSALIVGPCVTPPLAAALLYVAQTGNVAIGAVALFALGLGQGLPLIAFGTFGSGVLPKTGAWMNAIRKAFGFVFLAAAIWMASRIVPGNLTMLLWATLLVVAGVFLGPFDSRGSGADVPRRIREAAGFLSVLYGSILLVGAAAGSEDPLQPIAFFANGVAHRVEASAAPAFDDVSTGTALNGRLARATAEGKPTLVYFTADWCVTCERIDRNVLHKPAAVGALSGFSLVRIDLTKLDPAKQSLMSRLGVIGPPTMIFFDPASWAKPVTRLIGEVTLDELVTTAGKLRGPVKAEPSSDTTKG